MKKTINKLVKELKGESALSFQRAMEAKGFKVNFVLPKEAKNDPNQDRK